MWLSRKEKKRKEKLKQKEEKFFAKVRIGPPLTANESGLRVVVFVAFVVASSPTAERRMFCLPDRSPLPLNRFSMIANDD